ncbi:hypothetical protein GUITHDRAFT_103701 [Guillardia theta CCMP2712]|uniref:Uncharacterized protein n=1 Tax=Guillardia theta (strain CCMP2712) TaxID=905079 RepID=L1JPF0_GUITC|nr:hypothetical protein GUITHDRAFT_103701 [Guillardia theta CCMP2712]EKX50466.1 hypothetical protein GUITHDRAFT_103701 [Guillardia theta CCMP2712]|eukprot:XP_005837446.1 hypothetical protein GUITHDRAFT_103701 [Guillardia theta CCMP2712]
MLTCNSRSGGTTGGGRFALDEFFEDSHVVNVVGKSKKKLPSVDEMMEQMREMIAHATNTPIKPWKGSSRTFSPDLSASPQPSMSEHHGERKGRETIVKLPNSVIYGSKAGYESLVQSFKHALKTSEKKVAGLVEDVQGYFSDAFGGGQDKKQTSPHPAIEHATTRQERSTNRRDQGAIRTRTVQTRVLPQSSLPHEHSTARKSRLKSQPPLVSQGQERFYREKIREDEEEKQKEKQMERERVLSDDTLQSEDESERRSSVREDAEASFQDSLKREMRREKEEIKRAKEQRVREMEDVKIKERLFQEKLKDEQFAEEKERKHYKKQETLAYELARHKEEVAESIRETAIRKQREEAAERLREKQARADTRRKEMKEAEGRELRMFRREDAYAKQVEKEQQRREKEREARLDARSTEEEEKAQKLSDAMVSGAMEEQGKLKVVSRADNEEGNEGRTDYEERETLAYELARHKEEVAESIRETAIRKQREEAAERLREKQARADTRRKEMKEAEGRELRMFRREDAYAKQVEKEQQRREKEREARLDARSTEEEEKAQKLSDAMGKEGNEQEEHEHVKVSALVKGSKKPASSSSLDPSLGSNRGTETPTRDLPRLRTASGAAQKSLLAKLLREQRKFLEQEVAQDLSSGPLSKFNQKLRQEDAAEELAEGKETEAEKEEIAKGGTRQGEQEALTFKGLKRSARFQLARSLQTRLRKAITRDLEEENKALTHGIELGERRRARASSLASFFSSQSNKLLQGLQDAFKQKFAGPEPAGQGA